MMAFWLVIVSNVILFALLGFVFADNARRTLSPKMFFVYAYTTTMTTTFAYIWLIVGLVELTGLTVESRLWGSIGVLAFAFVAALVTTALAVRNPVVDQPRRGPFGVIRGRK